MGRPLVEQRRLQHRGRQFHFVAYDRPRTKTTRPRPAATPAWWLMSAGRRWEVMPFESGRDPADLDRAFTAWLDTHVFGSLETSGG